MNPELIGWMMRESNICAFVKEEEILPSIPELQLGTR